MPEPIIPQSLGVTHAERYLKRLCDRTFLSMWSYTGIFNDKANGQEICDLLVVFGNHVIIFSDKDCAFPNSGKIEDDWKRWYKRAIKKSADQVYGAERWLRNCPDRIFLDQACTQRFPISLPSNDTAKYHRIVVAHSISSKCRELFGGSGSLIVNTGVVGDEQPFTIGRMNPSNGYVHVFDDTTLEILVSNLDTISDFVSYLERKERFLSGDTAVISTGEEELLAHYLKNLGDDGEHDFVYTKGRRDYTALFLDDEGSWQEFCRNPQRQVQIQANKISYSWDALIETFAFHAKNGTSADEHAPVKIGFSERETILRFMASENRTKRRFLAEKLVDLVKTTPRGQKRSRMIRGSSPEDPYYVFLVFPLEDYMEYDDYRRFRGALLGHHMSVAKLRFPVAKHIIGIATETNRGMEGSEDAGYLDATVWTPLQEEGARKVEAELQKFGLLGNGREVRKTFKEYPFDERQIQDFQKQKGRSKNLPCPCGSGRKFKRCCG